MDRQTGDFRPLAPDEQVAQRIVARLHKQGLVAPSQAGALQRSLAAGVLKAADWQMIAEQALEEEARHA